MSLNEKETRENEVRNVRFVLRIQPAYEYDCFKRYEIRIRFREEDMLMMFHDKRERTDCPQPSVRGTVNCNVRVAASPDSSVTGIIGFIVVDILVSV
jgi:hypothetical protein